MGKLLTCLPRLSLAQLRPTLWSTIALCTCRRDLYFPIALMGQLLTCLPLLTLAQLRTLRSTTVGTCLRDLQYSHRPMGKWLTRLPRLLLVHLRTLRSTPVGTCHRDLQKFPSPRWENDLLTCPCRFSSLMTGAASIYQSGVRAICA